MREVISERDGMSLLERLTRPDDGRQEQIERLVAAGGDFSHEMLESLTAQDIADVADYFEENKKG